MASYIHPSSGVAVVDVHCPKHAKVKGHVAEGNLGTATCGFILKSHKVTGPEEIDNGKKVRPTLTVVDEECREVLVADDAAKEQKAAAKEQTAGEATKGKTAKKGAKPVAKHPQAV